jgi:excisionase family DNA binding protein
MTDYLRSREAAEQLGVTTRTLINWADRGLLHPVRLPIGGERRWSREEIEWLRRNVLEGAAYESPRK